MDNLGAIVAIGAAIVIPIILLLTKKVVDVQHERQNEALNREARELEIKLRMSSGLSVVNDFNELARVYIALNRLADAEKCMQKALSITENELGQSDPSLVPILENYANILDQMNRKVEATKIRKRAKDVESKRVR